MRSRTDPALVRPATMLAPASPAAQALPAVAPAAAGTGAAAAPGPDGGQPGPRRGSEYAQLSRQVKLAGLLERRSRYYAWKIAATAAPLVAGWVIFVLVGDSWWVLAVAVLQAVIFTQVGFLGHDAGHRQIFGSRRANYVLGILLGNLGIGLSYGWWVDKHNRHHAHPNTEGADPDIVISTLAFTTSQARTVAQSRTSGRLRRLALRYQAYLFFPMLLLEAISLHVSSVRAVTSRASRHGPGETVLLAAHVIGYLAIVLLVLSPVKAVVFVVVQQGLFGVYLGSSFAPNHKGMAILPEGDQSDFLRRQVLTSRNVRGGWLTDYALGGLNYQIEHHLFPSMPRPNLRRSQALIAAYCRQREVPYCETSLIGSYAQALRYLNAVGRAATPAAALTAARR